MNDLLVAAKAVIADWDERQIVGDRNLRAAVERAEKQEAESIKFDERFHQWFIGHRKMLFELGTYDCAEMAWTAAQQAERERVKDIVDTIGVQGEHDAWFDACVKIMEAIDDL